MEFEDDDVAIRSHYPATFSLSMSRRFPRRKIIGGSPTTLQQQLSPLSRRRKRKTTTCRSRRQSLMGKPWHTKNLARMPRLTLKPHEPPPPPLVPLMSKRRNKRSTDQRENTLRAIQRWKARKQDRMNRTKNKDSSDIDSTVNKSCRQSAATISNDLALFLCDVSGTMIKEFRKFDDDLSGELSKEEFEALLDNLRKKDNFQLSRQDADLLYMAFDDDQSGSITTREVCEGLFACHHRCPTNIIGQRLPPRKVREHHDEKHGLQPATPRKKSVYAPLMMRGGMIQPEEGNSYYPIRPSTPKLPEYKMSPMDRRANFLWESDLF